MSNGANYPMNTPSGEIASALDMFILHYATQGYEWMNRARATYYNQFGKQGEKIRRCLTWMTDNDDDIVFFKEDSVLIASAKINEETNHITGYDITELKQ